MTASGEPEITQHVKPPDEHLLLTVPGSGGLVGPPRRSFEEAVAEFAADVLSEASLRETSDRGSTSTEVQYTSAHFEYAKSHVRNAGYFPKSPWWYLIVRILTPLMIAYSGLALSLALAPGGSVIWGLTGGIAAGIGLVLTIVAEVAPKGKK